MDLGKDKSPSNYGYTFWAFNLDTLKLEVVAFFYEFHATKRFMKGLNSTFLVLIPKKGRDENIKDFRSISMVRSLNKLLAKVLANRLKEVMNKLVLDFQQAFVEGRQILDASLIAKEAINSLRRGASLTLRRYMITYIRNS